MVHAQGAGDQAQSSPGTGTILRLCRRLGIRPVRSTEGGAIRQYHSSGCQAGVPTPVSIVFRGAPDIEKFLRIMIHNRVTLLGWAVWEYRMIPTREGEILYDLHVPYAEKGDVEMVLAEQVRLLGAGSVVEISPQAPRAPAGRAQPGRVLAFRPTT